MKTLEQISWFALVAAGVWSGVMGLEARHYIKRDCAKEQGVSRLTCTYTPPIAALELATSSQTFRNQIDQNDANTNELWNTEITRVNTCMDFLFVGFYWGAAVCLARMQRKWSSVPAIFFMSLTAAFDLAENVRLLQALHGISSHETDLAVPGYVSEAKCALFAIALLMLGIAVHQRKKPWSVVIAILLIGAAGLSLGGIYWLPLLLASPAFLSIAFLVAIFYYFPFRPFGWSRLLTWIEFAYLIRFQLMAGLVLAIVLPSCYFLVPSLFVGLFDALGFWSFVCVASASLLLGWTVMITARLVLVYGPDRFAGLEELKVNEQNRNLSWTQWRYSQLWPHLPSS